MPGQNDQHTMGFTRVVSGYQFHWFDHSIYKDIIIYHKLSKVQAFSDFRSGCSG